MTRTESGEDKLAEARPILRRGRIIWARVADPRGNKKLRPMIVLTRTDEIVPGQFLAVMAITTTYPEPPPATHIELPWHRNPRNVGTGLGKRCAAVINWLRLIDAEEIEELAGDVPPKLMLEILKRLERDRTEPEIATKHAIQLDTSASTLNHKNGSSD